MTATGRRTGTQAIRRQQLKANSQRTQSAQGETQRRTENFVIAKGKWLTANSNGQQLKANGQQLMANS
jgi:hypothetical protein